MFSAGALRAAVLLLALHSARPQPVAKCAFGDGAPAAAQPSGDAVLTCTPPARSGAGTVELTVEAPGDAYLDAQLFRYEEHHVPTGRGLVKVAALALGADGGCSPGACGALQPGPAPGPGGGGPYCPPGYPGKPTNSSEKEQRISEYLNEAARQGADLAVLPENAYGGPWLPANCRHAPEPLDGPLVSSIRAVAKRHRMNIVLPIHEALDGRQYNTAVVIDREGAVVGVYRKVFPVWGDASQRVPPTAQGGGEVGPPDNVTPSSAGVVAFDLDFGRIAVLVCFDTNFSELWQQAAALGAELVVYPSANSTPEPRTYAYAALFQYDIVSVGFPADVIDRTGDAHPTQPVAGFPMMKLAKLDLDRTFVHYDFNAAKMKRLLAENPQIVLERDRDPWWLLRSTAANVSARALCRQYAIETNRQYIHRSRQGLNQYRATVGL